MLGFLKRELKQTFLINEIILSINQMVQSALISFCVLEEGIQKLAMSSK